jgi:DNA phosphorothioation-associated putative methyltransferase
MSPELPIKKIGKTFYVSSWHRSRLSARDTRTLSVAETILGDVCSGANVYRFTEDSDEIALLRYEDFSEVAFPALIESWNVKAESERYSHRSYLTSSNPPILHRKELLLEESDPRYKLYSGLTKKAEELGLFSNPKSIGFRKQWEQLISQAGYQLIGHELAPLGNDVGIADEEDNFGISDDPSIRRHLTAIARTDPSAPVMTLARNGFLTGDYTFFDYGCGRGNDVEVLKSNEIDASGWDPYHAKDGKIREADIVNLGFVINVIEDKAERLDALVNAYTLSRKLLVVSVMLENDFRAGGRSFSDGIVTSRGTFQKYFTQQEIREYIEKNLDEDAIPVGPGIHYVFRDKDLQDSFLKNKNKRRRYLYTAPRLSDEQRLEIKQAKRQEQYQAHSDDLRALWEQWLLQGRLPEPQEFSASDRLANAFGSLKKASRFLLEFHDPAMLDVAAHARSDDMLVAAANGLFSKKKSYKDLSAAEQKDIKYFFGGLKNLREEAGVALKSIANVELLKKLTKESSEQGNGFLDEEDALTLHSSLVELLPATLRIYVEVSSYVAGNYRDFDLVKIHTQTGKVSLMRFDDFLGKPLPKMLERLKINLWKQEVRFFSYDQDFPPPYLYFKSRFINEDFEGYEQQLNFEASFEDCGLKIEGYGPQALEFDQLLATKRLVLTDLGIKKSEAIPSLDDSCGQSLTFRSLIECGETQRESGLANLPKEIDSYHALERLAENILDPVIDYFGMVRLTYGFCSHELSRKIPERIDPRVDQHCCYELNTKKKQICERGGAACDFIVDDESMLEVAQWIVSSLPFDRLYFYGDDKPIHVSYGPENSRSIVMMKPSKDGSRLLPAVLTQQQFLSIEGDG